MEVVCAGERGRAQQGGHMSQYDLVVLGSGPSGQKAAIAGAKLGRRVAMVERRHMIGGVCIQTGTIPSKTLRESVLYLTGLSQHEFYGQGYRLKDNITFEDLTSRTTHVVGREVDVIRSQLSRNRVALLQGSARFNGPHEIAIEGDDDNETHVTGEKVIIAVGTRPARPPSVDFDGRTIVDSDQVLDLDRIPATMVVVGGGVIGIEYASMFAALGTKVTVVERRERMLEFCDDEIVEGLQHQLRDLGVTFRLGEEVTAVKSLDQGALIELASGKRIAAEAVLYSAGREGATEGLGLELAGLAVDERGRIPVGRNFRTDAPNIYAVGDVIGFPSLAATAMEQ